MNSLKLVTICTIQLNYRKNKKGVVTMAKILTKEIQQINNACSNGWRLDTQYFLYHGEKRLIKHIELDNENYLQFALQYNYKNQISMHISKYNHKQNDTFATSERIR